MSTSEQQPWFAGASGPVLLFKVNRRPRPQNLFGDTQPDDVLDHLAEVLLFGEPIVTGRKINRTWRLGNRSIDLAGRSITGQVGWERVDQETVDAFDSKRQQWVDVVQPTGHSARSVFAFDAATRHLAVVKHPTFSDTVLPKLFCELLNRGEAARPTPTTDWDVEPILDEAEFRDWLSATSAVERVRFVAKLPNPGGLDDFEDIWKRLEELNASSIEETIQARDPDAGLGDITADPISAQFIAMASHAFGYITATGAENGRPTKYDQREQVKRVYRNFPEEWQALAEMAKRIARGPGGESAE